MKRKRMDSDIKQNIKSITVQEIEELEPHSITIVDIRKEEDYNFLDDYENKWKGAILLWKNRLQEKKHLNC